MPKMPQRKTNPSQYANLAGDTPYNPPQGSFSIVWLLFYLSEILCFASLDVKNKTAFSDLHLAVSSFWENSAQKGHQVQLSSRRRSSCYHLSTRRIFHVNTA